MEEKEKNQIPEIGDEELDGVAGGSRDDPGRDYCPYCKEDHYLRRLGHHIMQSGKIVKAYQCILKRRPFYKVSKAYFDEREQRIT